MTTLGFRIMGETTSYLAARLRMAARPGIPPADSCEKVGFFYTAAVDVSTNNANGMISQNIQLSARSVLAVLLGARHHWKS